MKRFIIFAFVVVATLACNSSKQKNKVDAAAQAYYTPEFSQRFAIEKHGDDKILTVHNPWQGSKNVKFTYTLSRNTEKNSDAIKIPVQRAICLSSTHIAFIDFVGETDKIVGVSGAGYVSNEKVQQRISEKKVLDVGYENYLSYEIIASLKPDVVFAYGIDGEMGNVEAKLKSMGIKLVYIGEYLEQSPLAKAEWAIAIAAFFDKENLARQKFDTLKQEYNNLKTLAATAVDKPQVLINAPYKDVWYIPSRNSAMINLLKDAGGDYIFDAEANTDSKPVGIEYAYNKAQNADVWINLNAEKSLAQVFKLDGRLAAISAFKNAQVYNNIKRCTSQGGSDFWESGVVRPQVILKDLIKIFHPQLLPDYELYYYLKLE